MHEKHNKPVQEDGLSNVKSELKYRKINIGSGDISSTFLLIVTDCDIYYIVITKEYNMKLVEQISAKYHCVDYFGNVWNLIVTGDYTVSYPAFTLNDCDHIYINSNSGTEGLDIKINKKGIFERNRKNGELVNLDRNKWILPDGSVEIIRSYRPKLN